MVVHQQYWHTDKPDSTGKRARSRGSRSGLLPHQRLVWVQESEPDHKVSVQSALHQPSPEP